MWILNFLPDWVLYLSALIGLGTIVASKFISLIPSLAIFRLPLSVSGFAIVVVSAWLIGMLSSNAIWQARAKELQEKIDIAEAKSKEENVRIETKVVKKLELVRLRGEQIIEYVDREVKVYDTQCVIPKTFVEAHNKAAEPVK
jgi:hypothetical protein